jgi:SAM-dependent methyltransferase
MDFKGKKGILLDVGCGANKNEGFVGIDIRSLKGVDIVQDLEAFPWPLDDNSCKTIIGSHIIEHISPIRGTFLKFMAEIWRILEPGGQVAFAYPYGVGEGFQQDPTHCNPCNHATWQYFDPGYFLWSIYETPPFKVIRNEWNVSGQGEVLLTKISERTAKKRIKERKNLEAQHEAEMKEANKKAIDLHKKRIEERKQENRKHAQMMLSKNRDVRISGIIANKEQIMHRLLYGVPMTGLVRSEWVDGRMNQVIPTNWSKVDLKQMMDQWAPLGYSVADARNIIATNAVELEFEWVFFHDHDVVLPQGAYIILNDLMIRREVPVWSGLYWTKSVPAEPLLYRRRGTGPHYDWKFGDKVWVDGIPMGCTMIHGTILKEMYLDAEEYYVGDQKIRKIFETPVKTLFDPKTQSFQQTSGTEDIQWCHKVITERYFDKAGWPEYQEMEWPFLVDTSIYCRHISNDGMQFPMRGEDLPHEPYRIDIEQLARNDSTDAMLK